MKAIDPICGMEMDEGMIHSKLTFKGKEYYFDSESCETLFRKLNKIELPAKEEPAIAETEKKMIAYNTLKQLAVTIAHYIRNANTAISALLSLSDIKLRKYVMTEEEAILDLRNTLKDKLLDTEELK